MPGNGNGGGGLFSESFGGGFGLTLGEGGVQGGDGNGGGGWTTGEGGAPVIDPEGTGWLGRKPKPKEEPQPRQPVIREARNVQRANIDRSSFHDPSVATLGMGAEYLSSRNATNPRPQGDTGVGAVGYEFVPSNERLY